MEKGPKTQVPPAGFLRPGIRRHKGPAGRGPRWQEQGLSRRRKALRPPLVERGPPETRVAGLRGQAPCTLGRRPGDSVSARSDPRTQPGRAPVSLLPKANAVVQTRNPNSVIAGRSVTEKFPAALPTGVFLLVERNDGILGEASGLGRSPPHPAQGSQGSWPSPASSPRVAGAPRGRALLIRSRLAPHLEPQAGSRRRPPRSSAPAAGSVHPAAGPRAAGRPSPSCSPPARRAGGGAASIYIKGEPARRAEPRESVGPQQPAPRAWPRLLKPCAVEAGAQGVRPRGAGTAPWPIRGSRERGGGAATRVNMHEALPARP